MKLYGSILQGSEATLENARNHALGFDWDSCEISEGSNKNLNYIDTLNGVDIWYNYGADYYCFSPNEDYKDLVLYTSSEILKADDLYELQDTFGSSGIPFQYQMTEGELGWLRVIQGKYSIGDYIHSRLVENIVTFDDVEVLSQALADDGIPYKAVMLSDETALQRILFWVSIND